MTPEPERESWLPPNLRLFANVVYAAPTPQRKGKGPQKSGDEDRDHKNTDSQFASHLKASTGASNFSRTKSLKQQRQYLPAFASREALLKVIRENQGSSQISFSARRPADHDLFSRHLRRRDWIRENDSAHAVLARGGLQRIRDHWLHSASSCRRHECRQASQRGDGGECWPELIIEEWI